MLIREITNANNVRHVNKEVHSHSEYTPPISKETMKNASNKKLAQNIEKLMKNETGEGRELLI